MLPSKQGIPVIPPFASFQKKQLRFSIICIFGIRAWWIKADHTKTSKGHMIYFRQKKRSVYLKVISLLLCVFLITTAKAQSDPVLVIKGQASLKDRAKGLGGNVGVSSVNWKEAAAEGVDIEVKKNGVTIAKATSGKKGKYSIEIPVSTADAKSEFIIYYSKDGAAPRMVQVNTYVSKDEYSKYSSTKYEFEQDVPLFGTTVKDIVPDKFYAKIKWDNVKDHKFTTDQAYAKTVVMEERKIEANADVYYTTLIKKKKKQDEALAKKNAAADAKLKAAEDAKKKLEEEARLKAKADADKLAQQKAQEEADRIQREKDEALRNELRKKRIADSLAEIERKKALEVTNTTVDIKKTVRTAEENKILEKDPYDAYETYSVNIARRSLFTEKEKRNKEKSRNLSAKYETINVLTSLLNMVDEHDKKGKKQ